MSVGGVVVLGASGHIGAALTTVLRADGGDVTRHSSRTLDLTRPDAADALGRVVGPETTLVLAAALTPDRGQNITTLSANIAMATSVARCLESHAVRRCVYVSSDAVYGFERNPVTETTSVAPTGYYAFGKYAGEKILELVTAARQIPLLVLRVTGVYGPGDPHGAYGPNAFARTLARDRSLRLFGDGEEQRDHIFVDDVARLAAELIRREATGIFNLATGESRSFAEVVDTIRGLIPYDVVVTNAPRKGAITHRHFETTALRRAVPDFRFTAFKDGVRATLGAFGALGHA